MLNLLERLVDDALLAVIVLTWLAVCILLGVYTAWWFGLAGLLLGTPFVGALVTALVDAASRD